MFQKNNAPLSELPKHVAIIMDGNGRWASARGLPRTMGHRQGVKALRKTVQAASDMGIEYLTVFGFSSENWSRPEYEVSELLRLMRFYLRNEMDDLIKNNIRLKIIGDISAFDPSMISLIEQAQERSSTNTGLNLNVALNYGGRADILHAAKSMAERYKNGQVQNFEQEFELSLMSGETPAPDLLIRTSGEQRISNFLLWQCAYSEFVFTETYWPDFDRNALEGCIQEYFDRDRRFGGLKDKKTKAVQAP